MGRGSWVVNRRAFPMRKALGNARRPQTMRLRRACLVPTLCHPGLYFALGLPTRRAMSLPMLLVSYFGVLLYSLYHGIEGQSTRSMYQYLYADFGLSKSLNIPSISTPHPFEPFHTISHPRTCHAGTPRPQLPWCNRLSYSPYGVLPEVRSAYSHGSVPPVRRLHSAETE